MSTQKKKAIALNSVFASAGLTIMKLIVGILTGSIGIISEAAHSALDFIAALITYFAVRVSDNPADKTHHYGHGKIESISALVETALLFVTSGWIIYESIHRLSAKSIEVEATWYAFVVIAISIVVDISRSRALYKVAKETNSQALEADALHFNSDIYSSAVVFVGLGFVAFGIKGADAVAAIIVAFFVLYAGYQLGKRTIDNLLDAAPIGMTDEIKTIAQNTIGVLEIGRIRVRPAGPATFIDMVIHVSRKTPLERTHKITQQIEQKIHEKIKNSDIVIHVKPVAINNENMIERVQIVSSSHNLVANNILIQNLVGKKILNFDLEVKEIMTLEEGHRAADHIEKTLQKEFGADTEINIHIEPMNRTEIITDKIDQNKLDQINKLITNYQSKNPEIHDIHNLNVRSDNKKLHISFHGVIKGKTGIIEAHDLTHRFEKNLKDALPDAEKVIIHIEPEKCV
jgi:cation diffusion facilitator family transporter